MTGVAWASMLGLGVSRHVGHIQVARIYQEMDSEHGGGGDTHGGPNIDR